MAGLHRSSSRNVLPPQELLDDLCSRFVLNVPKEDLESFERILFLVEQAHWFYEDNSVEQNPTLKSLSLREFTSLMFNSCAALRPYIAHIDDIYKDFTSYKYRVPVTGAIILDESYDKFLKAFPRYILPAAATLVLINNSWIASLPRLPIIFVVPTGKRMETWFKLEFSSWKKNKDEEDHTCAIREVLEETGFDISKLLKMDDHVEVVVGQQRVRLYIIAGVKEGTVFAPLTKKEISEISWFRIDDLLPAGDDMTSRGANGLKLYMVGHFLAPLKAWISAHPPATTQRSDTPAKGSSVWKAKGGSSGGAVSNESALPGAGSGAPADTRPGRSFRNFRFDAARILQALDAGFGA